MKVLHILFFALLVSHAQMTAAQIIPTIQWQKCLGGTDDDRATAVQQTTDEGFIVAGHTMSSDGDVSVNYGNYDYWIVKLDTAGNITWQKSFGGTGNEEAQSIQQTSDQGFIIAGYSDSDNGDVTGNHGSNDYWIVKLDGSGNLQWQKSLGGTGDDLAKYIRQTSDGGYIIAGNATSQDGDVTGNHGEDDVWIVKLDENGVIAWQQSYGGNDSDYANFIEVTSDGGFIVCGASSSINGDVTQNNGQLDYWILKLSSTGILEWQKSYGGSESEEAFAVQQTSDDGFIIGGRTYSNDIDVSVNHGNLDCWIVKIDQTGNMQWQKSFGGSGYDHVFSIYQMADETYMFAGYTTSYDGDASGNHGVNSSDYWVVLLDASGNLLKQKCLGGSKGESLSEAIVTNEGAFVLAGLTSSDDWDVSGNHEIYIQDYWIVKLDCELDYFYADTDGDGYGITTDSLLECKPPIGWATNHNDCNDGNPSVHPATWENTDNNIDDNCDGVIDEDGAIIPYIVWQKSFGGTLNDRGIDIIETSDGGLISAGWTYSNDGDVSGNHGNYDYWILKLDASGNKIWQKCLGGTAADQAEAIAETPDHGFIVAGSSYSNNGDVTGNHGGKDCWIVRLDSSGNILWQKSLGGSQDDDVESIITTPDGGFVIAANTKSTNGDVSGNHGFDDYWIVKLNAAGDIVWQKCLGGYSTDVANEIQITPDGGYIVTGFSGSDDWDVSENHGENDLWIVKLDAVGNIIWQKCYGGTEDENGISILQLADGGYMAAGLTLSDDGDVSGLKGDSDFWVIRLNAEGELIWQRCLGGSGPEYQYSSLLQIPGDRFMLAGTTDSDDGDVSGFKGFYDYWVTVIDTLGNVQWQKCLGGTGQERAFSVIPVSDGFIINGYSDSDDFDVSGNHGGLDMWVVKLSAETLPAGTPQTDWTNCYGGSDYESANAVLQTADNGYIIAGNAASSDGDVAENLGGDDYWITRLDSAGNLVWQQSLGGTFTEQAASISPTTDGGYIITGFTLSSDGDVTGNNGNKDYWIVKLDSLGSIMWQQSLGGSDLEEGLDIKQTFDGGFIATGFSFSNDGDVSGNHGNGDAWVIKLDAGGNPEWQKCFGGSLQDELRSVIQVTDGYILAGRSSSNDGDVFMNHGLSDCWIVKLDNDGNLVWEESYGGSNNERVHEIQQAPDGGLIFSGETSSSNGDVSMNHGWSDCWIVKLDSSGLIEWERALGGSYLDMAYSIQATQDQKYIIAGQTASPNDGDVSGNQGNADFWLFQLDGSGSLDWQKCLGGSSDETAYSLKQTSDGGFTAVGYTLSTDGDVVGNHGSGDYWVVKLSCGEQYFYEDLDSDGYGTLNDSILSCNAPPGWAANVTDCNDTSNAIHPGAMEITGNGLDDDCNGLIDDICSADFLLVPDSIVPHHYWLVDLSVGIDPVMQIWSWGDGTSDTASNPSHTYDSAGFYNICLYLTDATGCSDSSCVEYDLQKSDEMNLIITVDVVDSIPGIPTADTHPNVLISTSVFPNPATKKTLISFSISSPAIIQIELLDILGNRLRKTLNDFREAGIHQTEIETQDLPSGLYILRIRAGDELIEKKLAVIK